MQQFLFVRTDGKYEKVNFAGLNCIWVRRRDIQVATQQKRFLLLTRIELEQKHLPKELFCRVHRSYIIAIERIRAFDNYKVYLYGQPEGKEYGRGLARA